MTYMLLNYKYIKICETFYLTCNEEQLLFITELTRSICLFGITSQEKVCRKRLFKEPENNLDGTISGRGCRFSKIGVICSSVGWVWEELPSSVSSLWSLSIPVHILSDSDKALLLSDITGIPLSVELPLGIFECLLLLSPTNLGLLRWGPQNNAGVSARSTCETILNSTTVQKDL